MNRGGQFNFSNSQKTLNFELSGILERMINVCKLNKYMSACQHSVILTAFIKVLKGLRGMAIFWGQHFTLKNHLCMKQNTFCPIFCIVPFPTHQVLRIFAQKYLRKNQNLRNLFVRRTKLRKKQHFAKNLILILKS